jgi:5'-nucleotidase
MKLKQLALATGLAFATLAVQAGAPTTVKILGFNDYHGNLQSPGTFGVNTSIPAASRPPVGGAEYVAGLVASLKAQNPNNVVVGAGDFIGASPLISALFNDEPAVETLNKIGMEFSSVGNHEFDKGKVELLRLQNGGCKIANGAQDPNSCKGYGSTAPGTFDGAKFKWLSANVVDTATGRSLLSPYGIKSFKDAATGKTVRVGFIGMTLKDTPTIVTPSGVAGLSFKDEADTVNAQVPRLRALGVEAIVVLVHQGGFQSSGFSDINGCDGNLAGSEIAKIVNRLDDAVDLVISGHTHAAYNCSTNTVDIRSVSGTITSTPRATGVANKVGRLIPVTSASAFGRVVTDVDMTIDTANGQVIAVSPTNRLVNRTTVSKSATVETVVNQYNQAVSPLANQIIGSITTALPNTGDEMPAGDLIADAQLEATKAPAPGNAVIAFMNRGGVRNPGFTYASSIANEGDGNVTYGEAFAVQPFGNILQTLTLTAQQLKNVLEQQWNGCKISGEPTQTTDRIMQVSNGFKYTWDSTVAASACNRVKKMELNGTAIYDASQGGFQVDANTTAYRVTVNNFMATGGDGFTVLTRGTNIVGGGQDIDALVAYFANFKSPNAYDPTAAALNKPRIIKLP